MKKINWQTYKFHPSVIDTLMTQSRSGSDLSETTKSKLDDIYLDEVFQYKEDVKTDAMAKGIEMETESLNFLDQFGMIYFKNTKSFENDYLIGTPDVVTKSVLLDIKTSWDIGSFFKTSEEKALKRYKWQMKSYMILTGKTEAQLCFCLIDTPEHIINKLISKLEWQFRDDDSEKAIKEFDRAVKTIRMNHLVSEKRNEVDLNSEIPSKHRMKIYNISLEKGDEEQLETSVKEWREYLTRKDIELSI